VDPALRQALEQFAARERVVVGVDFDGTLAPLVDEPTQARALPGSLELLVRLAALPGVDVAVVSGRDLASLRQVTGLGPEVTLIGSHGAEMSRDDEEGEDLLTAEEQARLETLDRALVPLLEQHPEVRLEHKPTSRVLHTRGVDDETARAALAAGEALLEQVPGVHATPGKDVLELSVTETGKGQALRALARAHHADAILYLGDDVTDERAFAELGPDDLTVRVGPGETVAAFRVADERGTVEVLQAVLELRARTLSGA
jgi:trehalose 6-phosphate phosphatase